MHKYTPIDATSCMEYKMYTHCVYATKDITCSTLKLIQGIDKK